MSNALTDLMHESTEALTPSVGFTDAVLRGGRRRRVRSRAVLTVTTSALTVACVAAGTLAFGSSSPDSAGLRFGAGGLTPAAHQLQTFCLLPEGQPEDGPFAGPTDLIGPTGDPVDNCARFWRNRLKSAPPPLVAYQDRFGNVTVQAKSNPLPEGSTVLPPGVVQNAQAIELSEAFGDSIGLGPDHCRSRAVALRDAKRVVSELGFADWPVVVDDGRTDTAAQQCWGFGPRPHEHLVTVTAMGGGFDYPQVLEDIARPLRASLTQCWSRQEAISQVRASVERSSLKDEFKKLVEIREVDVPGASCTIVRMGGGGGINFTLRGPA